MAPAQSWDVVVIGAGMAGLSTAIWARRVGLSALVLEQEATAGGQLHAIRLPLVDYPGLDEAGGPALAQRLREQAETAGAVLQLGAPVGRLDLSAHTCQTDHGLVVGRALVIATGISARSLGVPGEAVLKGRGLIHRPSIEPEWFRDKQVAVIGGGDRAVENALLLQDVARAVTVIHRGPALRARPEFIERLEAASAVEIRLDTAVTAIGVDDAGEATLQLQAHGQTASVTVDAVCIYIGNRPNTDLVAGQLATGPDGYILTDRNGETSVPGVYAVGDVCTPPEYQSLVGAAGQAMVAAKHIALRG